VYVFYTPKRVQKSSVVLTHIFQRMILTENMLFIFVPGMTGLYFEDAARIKEVVNASLQVTHCIIHLEMLSSIEVAAVPSEVLSHGAKVAKFMRSNAPNSQIVKVLWVDMNAEHVNLSLHAEGDDYSVVRPSYWA
jgi:hypothetical protein